MTLKDELKDKGINFELLAKKEGYKLQKDWLGLFARELHEKTGKWVEGNHMWIGLTECETLVRNTETYEKYQNQEIEPFYIFDEGCRHCYACEAEEYPDFTGQDMYIFPHSKKWTMAFSHMKEAYFVTNEI